VVRGRGVSPFRQIFWSRNGAPASIVGHRWNANTEAFRQITSYSLGWPSISLFSGPNCPQTRDLASKISKNYVYVTHLDPVSGRGRPVKENRIGPRAESCGTLDLRSRLYLVNEHAEWRVVVLRRREKEIVSLDASDVDRHLSVISQSTTAVHSQSSCAANWCTAPNDLYSESDTLSWTPDYNQGSCNVSDLCLALLLL